MTAGSVPEGERPVDVIDIRRRGVPGIGPARSCSARRGVSLFSERVLRVRRGGGVAAVIYNDVVTDPTCGAFVGSLGTAWPTIPAITPELRAGRRSADARGLGRAGGQPHAPTPDSRRGPYLRWK